MFHIIVLMVILAYGPPLLANSGEDPQRQIPSDTLNAYQKEVNRLKEKILKTPVITYSQSGVECHILIAKPYPGIDYKILQVAPDKRMDFKSLKSDLIKRKALKIPELNEYESPLK